MHFTNINSFNPLINLHIIFLQVRTLRYNDLSTETPQVVETEFKCRLAPASRS